MSDKHKWQKRLAMPLMRRRAARVITSKWWRVNAPGALAVIVREYNDYKYKDNAMEA